MVVIVQCVIWGNVFKFVYVETVNECHHKMKKDSFQMIFGFLLKDMEVAFKLKSTFSSSIFLEFNWKCT